MSKTAGRNDPCPCGSQKKYKNCCWGKDLPQSQVTGRSFIAKALGGSASSALQKKFKATVISGGQKDLVERTFNEVLAKPADELPPAPATQEIPENVLPADYQPWQAPESGPAVPSKES